MSMFGQLFMTVGRVCVVEAKDRLYFNKYSGWLVEVHFFHHR